MPVKLNGATSGSVQLDVPAAIGSDLQLTLPATAGDVVVKAADGSVDLGSVDIDSSGNVGIGTSAPGNMLHISGASPAIRLSDSGANGGAFDIIEDNNGLLKLRNDAGNSGTGSGIAFDVDSAERMRIDSSGRLLVGTSNGSGGVSKLVVQGASNGSAVGVAQISYNGLASAGFAAGTDIGYLRFTDQGSNSGVFAQITATADATTGSGDYPGRLVFSTSADGASSPTERLRIDSSGTATFAGDVILTEGRVKASRASAGTAGVFSGFLGSTLTFEVTADGSAYFGSNVGIGTTSPSSTLHIATTPANASSPVAIRVGNDGSGSGTGASISLGAGSGAASTAGNIAGFFDGTGTALSFSTSNSYGVNAFTERARIDSSGRLLVGTSGSSANVSAVFHDNSASNGPAQILLATSSTTPTSAEALARIHFSATNQSFAATIEGSRDGGTWTAGSSQPSKLTFSTTADGASSTTERMRIASDGRHFTFSAGALTHRSPNGANSSDALFLGIHSSTSTTSGGTASFYVRTNGNVQNTNNSYTAISDITLKENIVPASDQWDNIKNIEVVNFNFKEETGHETHKQLGVIAQQVEEVSPGLVNTNEDSLKSVNYSVLYMKAVKALQEAMERIETLETKVASLEANS